jgi:glycine C-acetyltransferase
MEELRNASSRKAAPSTRHAESGGNGSGPENAEDGSHGVSTYVNGGDRDAIPGAPTTKFSDYDYSNFYYGSGEDPFAMLEPFEDWWEEARPAGYYLFGQPMSTAPRCRVDIVETKSRRKLEGLLNFASYNYLGLSYRPEVIEAAREATLRYGLGASGSPILSGTMDLHEELAEKLARFKRKEAVILFPTGYSANVGLIAGLMRPGDLVVADQWAHASIVDGIILSKANARFFRHNNMEDLERKLAGFRGKKLIIVEGVYSMDGDVARLPEVVQIARKYGARVMIDEAHSTFIYGENGRGVVEHFGLEDEVDVHLGTFSKSLGGIGGYVAGSRKLVNYLQGFARSRVFSCALPPGVVAGLIQGLAIAQAEPHLRAKLWTNVEFMQKRLRAERIDTGESTSQVIPIMIRNDAKVFKIAEELLHDGIYLQPINYPAVAKHRSRFRLSVSSAHSLEELESGARILTRVLRRNGICP